MVKIRRRAVLGACAVALVCALVLSEAALAAGTLNPQLRSPVRGKAVPVSHVRLTVYVPDPGDVINGHVFLTISDKRVLKHGLLTTPKHCAFLCNIGILKRVRHSAHLYYYVDPYHFPGNWQDTPGRYYWQVFYYPKNGVVFGVLPSRIGSFRIVG